jgi:large subunit ribosomal protein L20
MRAEKILKLAKGFRGRAKNTIRTARNRVEKGLQYAYRDRRAKKRDFRAEWIQQINAAAREHGVKYGEFMHGLKEENIGVNRKMLADLAQNEPFSFKALVDQVKRMKGIA